MQSGRAKLNFFALKMSFSKIWGEAKSLPSMGNAGGGPKHFQYFECSSITIWAVRTASFLGTKEPILGGVSPNNIAVHAAAATDIASLLYPP